MKAGTRVISVKSNESVCFMTEIGSGDKKKRKEKLGAIHFTIPWKFS